MFWLRFGAQEPTLGVFPFKFRYTRSKNQSAKDFMHSVARRNLRFTHGKHLIQMVDILRYVKIIYLPCRPLVPKEAPKTKQWRPGDNFGKFCSPHGLFSQNVWSITPIRWRPLCPAFWLYIGFKTIKNHNTTIFWLYFGYVVMWQNVEIMPWRA